MSVFLTLRTPVFLMLLTGSLLAFFPAPGHAQWCGENGLIRFSFAPGDSLVPVIHQEPENGVTVVDLYVWLTDVVPVAKDGEAFLATGGFEFELEVEGAEAFILEKNVPIHHVDIGKTSESCIVGLDPGLSIKNGSVHLVQWKIMFQGRPEDVRFHLITEPGHSCKTLAGCVECRSPGMYVGVLGSGQLTAFFGAGCVPAYLNPTGEPDFTPDLGLCSFEDVGLFEAR